MAEDSLGSDFSAARAHAHLEMHIRECNRQRQEDREQRAEDQAELRANNITINARLDSLLASFDKRMSEQTASFDKRMVEMRAIYEAGAAQDRKENSNRMWRAAYALIAVLLAVSGYLLSKHII